MSKQEDCLRRGWPPAAVSGWRFGAKRRSDGKKREARNLSGGNPPAFDRKPEIQIMIKIVKIGGNVVDNEELLTQFCRDFARLDGPKILVHGGGALASKMQKQLGIEPQMVEGRRVTDEQTLRIVTMVYAGWCNKHITALLQAAGCDAIGLSGCDASVITAGRRPPRLLSDGMTQLDYGFVGDVTPASVNTSAIRTLMQAGLTPVFCAINHDGRGNLLNTNADTVASSISSALNAELLYCFEKNGVLYDKFDETSVIPSIGPGKFERLKAEGRIADGMIPKLENSFAALRAGAASVVIRHSSDLLSDTGTRLTLDDQD